MTVIYTTLPANTGTCPVCNGTGQAEHWGRMGDCRNCGGQAMYGTPKGYVPLRKDGTPCKHEYDVSSGGRCYTLYDCKHCGHHYGIDSGD